MVVAWKDLLTKVDRAVQNRDIDHWKCFGGETGRDHRIFTYRPYNNTHTTSTLSTQTSHQKRMPHTRNPFAYPKSSQECARPPHYAGSVRFKVSDVQRWFAPFPNLRGRTDAFHGYLFEEDTHDVFGKRKLRLVIIITGVPIFLPNIFNFI